MKEHESIRGRRNFILKGAAGLAGMTLLPSALSGEERVQPKETKERKLIYRKLGKTGLTLPIVSMGVMNADNPNLVRAALDAGITHLDTAHAYQRGRNEQMIGEVIKGRPRESYVIATKVVASPYDRKTGLFTKQTKAGPFVEMFETSLKRLQLDHVDVLYLHGVVRREAVLFEPLLSAMVKLKKEGKVRFIGVSTHSREPEVIQAAVDSKAYDVVLTAYNFRQPHRTEVKKAIEKASKAGLGVIAMKTQAGVFADRERQQPLNMKAALKWVLQDPNVHTSIPGFTTFDQMEMDLSVMEDLKLTPEEKADIKQHQEIASGGLFCPQCEECLPQCPHGLHVPTLMRSYMYAYGYKNLAAAKQTLGSLELTSLPCSGCTRCSVACASGYDVRGRAMDIARLKDVPEDFVIA